MTTTLIDKYNVPGPRYTSYPTVPFWNEAAFSADTWLDAARRCFDESNETDGISVYVHLPFCETPCTFCGCIKKFTRDHGVEAPYVSALIREWAMYIERLQAAPRIKELHLGGGTPTFFSADSLARLIDALVEPARLTPPFDFSFEANPGSTTEAHLRTLHERGFSRLSLGVQDLDPQVQRIINRVQPLQQVEQVTESARRLGYRSVNFDLIYGLPLQTPEGIARTMREVVRMRPDRIAFYGYAHVPWVKEASQRRFSEADIPRGEQKRALYEIGRELLLESGYHEVGMDHFALETDSLFESARNNRLHRNFMGYTPMHTRLSIGLGMSAISDAWYAFAQNAKSLKDYYASIDAGELAVFRGHQLTDEDLALRQLILDLMCRHETRLREEFTALSCADECLTRLAELARDGLVEQDRNLLRITERGKPFVRNVCMAFDARLWRDKPSTRLFSDTI
ncbi:MAG: oxygen-independent coproporphyrinogen III oxidase [Gammaproteobacteria bacterium]|nr:oxygen-independent coproporphyrinogen III oxidase [Gammaproteobacteria bacterium]